MKHLRTISILFVLLVLTLATLPATSASAAGTCFVDADAVGTNDGTSWTDAYTDLQSALGASPCTEVWVAIGTYKPTTGTDRNATFQLKNGVAIYGGFVGAETARDQRNHEANITILNGDLNGDDVGFTNNSDNSYHVVVGATGATLDGFTITGGNAYGGSCPGTDCGGGMYNASGSSPILTNIIFSNNTADFGGGMFNTGGSSPTLTKVIFSNNSAGSGGGMGNYQNSQSILVDVIFSGNSATRGGGMYNYSSNPTLTNITFSGNTSGLQGGGGIYNEFYSSPTLTNVTFSNNSSSARGGGMYNDMSSNPALTNVTFNGNSSADLGGGMYNGSSNPTIRNTIFWGNTASITAAAQIYNSGSTPVVSDSVVQDGYVGGTNIITSDPMLGALDDYSGFTQTIPLLPGSSAIDALVNGTNGCGTTITTDQRGVTRSQRNGCDIGAFEYDYTGIYYVKPVASGTENCQSWDNACTLQNALVTAISGDEIWVAAGTYKPTPGTDRTATFQLKDGVGVYGGFAGMETVREQRDWVANITVLSGDIDGNDITDPNGVVTDTANITGTNSYHVITSSGVTETAVLDGFTITAGQANGTAPYSEVCDGHYCGGGMYNDTSSPTLTNLTFSGNFAGNLGGAMYNLHSNPTLHAVIFRSNTVADGYGYHGAGGGGIHNQESSPVLIDVAFYDNWADYFGGGLNNDSSSPTLANVTFSGNQAGYGGGGMSSVGPSTPALNNVIFDGNYASEGGGMYNFNQASPTLTDVVFSGNISGTGGGMNNYAECSPTLMNVSFLNNQATGGGMYNYGSTVVMTQVLFSGNQGVNGGAMLNYQSSVTLTNVTIAGNLATEKGGGIYNDGSGSYIHSMLMWGQNTLTWGNQAGSGGDNLFNNEFSGPTIRYSLVGGCNPGGVWDSACGTDGGENLPDADPLFVAPEPASSAPTMAGDYRLQYASPAINAGDNAADLDGSGPLTTTIRSIPQDLDGNPRFVRVFIDLGAYENQTLHCPAGGVLYVDKDATGLETGESWNNAFVTLQDALYVTESCEIWVAAGTYKPTTGTDRTATFQLKDGVGVYGGFVGTETVRDQRNPATNVTILSGDLNGNDVGFTNNSENVYHVVTGAGNAILDGFTIMAGNANGASNTPDESGGGMYNNSSSPTVMNVVFSGNSATLGGGMYNFDSSPMVTNVTFSGNSATYGSGGMHNYWSSPTVTNVTFSSNSADSGGGMYNWDSNPTLTNVTFSGNSANDGGGGMHNYNSSPMVTNVTFSGNSATYGGGMNNYNSSSMVTNVTFSGNSATYGGGGMHNYNSSPTLTNVTFSDNMADERGGGMYNEQSNPIIQNNILWGNSGGEIYNNISITTVTDSVIEGGYAGGTNIITADPLLGVLGDHGGFTQTIPLLAYSSAIDTGNAVTCASTDQRGIARPQGARCDIGAFELVDNTAPDTSIDSKTPSATPTNSTSISFTFSGTDIDSGVRSFECDLDGGGFTACTSPKSYTGLTEGARNFQVRAINYLGMIDPSPASYAWTVDLIAPSLTIPANIIAEATSAAGRVVNYPAATATDNMDPNPVVVCLPASGSTFPLGLNTVNCTATDDAGNVAHGSFTITVEDTTDPILTIPADMLVNANRIDGAVVNFTTSASDTVDATPIVSCSPPSGSIFPIGITTVNCEATDDTGNTANDSFTITMTFLTATFRSVGTYDGHILESTETSSVGGAMNSTSTVFYLGDGAADKQYRSILHFDLNLPANAVITSATLKLKKQGLVGSDPFLTLGKIIADIRTGAFSNNNILQLTDFQAAAHKNTAAMIYNTPVNNWYSVAFPSSAFPFINKSGVTQFRLRFQIGDNDNGTADYLKFLSGDYATAAARPTLVIEYYLPIP